MSESYGILLHISSIPTDEPIGNIGLDAIQYLDFLTASGARYWQILPLQPVDQVHSPYASPSAFAGEIRYIDIKSLDDEDLVKRYNDLISQKQKTGSVDYDMALELKLPILKEYYRGRKDALKDALEVFLRENPWSWDYGLYEALKTHFEGMSWRDWPEGIRKRDPEDLEAFGNLLREEIQFVLFTQYLFSSQWEKLKGEAKKRNISIIGDIPMYVPFDSAEVWCNPQLFCLDPNQDPKWISGAPPDYFNPAGQRWNTPVYEWNRHKEDHYGWWKRRIAHVFECCDIVRLDHFRGFTSFWAVPPEEADASGGHWIEGPGMDFLAQLKETFSPKQFIVENLGDITPEVEQMKEEFGYPGMAVFQFAFNGNPENPHLPENVTKGQVYYTGTHDNPPLPAWYDALDDKTRELVHSEVEKDISPIIDRIIDKVIHAGSAFSMIQFQDLLDTDTGARMNTPGTVENNWAFKAPADLDLETLAEKMRSITQKGL